MPPRPSSARHCRALQGTCRAQHGSDLRLLRSSTLPGQAHLWLRAVVLHVLSLEFLRCAGSGPAEKGVVIDAYHKGNLMRTWFASMLLLSVHVLACCFVRWTCYAMRAQVSSTAAASQTAALRVQLDGE